MFLPVLRPAGFPDPYTTPFLAVSPDRKTNRKRTPGEAFQFYRLKPQGTDSNLHCDFERVSLTIERLPSSLRWLLFWDRCLLFPDWVWIFSHLWIRGVLSSIWSAAPGTSLESTVETFRRVENIIHDTIPEVVNQNSEIGIGEAFGAFSKGSFAGTIRVNPD